tara:strand:+ start:517 stop:702 length:186 start_codon:yes stop_codon:yes gene_type:complete
MMTDKLNSIELVKLALIFTRNNSEEFFKTCLMKQTNYTSEELENLTNNYVSSNKLSLERLG